MSSITLKADPEAIDKVTAFVEGECLSHRAGPDDTYAILLMVDELVANVCHYAYPDGEGEFEVEVTFDSGLCSLKFTDSGVPFDPTQLEDPDTTGSVEERKVGGFGIYFIRKKSERFEYRRDESRNVVTVVKRLGR